MGRGTAECRCDDEVEVMAMEKHLWSCCSSRPMRKGTVSHPVVPKPPGQSVAEGGASAAVEATVECT